MFEKLRLPNAQLIKLCLIALLIFAVTGCAWENQLPPEEALNRAVAGLSGVDNFSFKGNAAIRSGEDGVFQQSLAFEGELKNHNRLMLSTEARGRRTVQDYESTQRSSASNSRKVALRRSQGKWSMLSPGESEEMLMLRLNPLEQLEYLGKAERQVSEETGAARGTRVLRVKLSPEDASQATKNTLIEQMEVIGKRIEKKGDPLYSDDPSVRERLKALWQKENAELVNMLEKAEVNAVYHVTINKRTQLPTRMTMERRISYPDAAGGRRVETLLSDITFTRY